MNTLDAWITKILSAPYQLEADGAWFVDVEYDCYGLSTMRIECGSLKAAKALKVGDEFIT